MEITNKIAIVTGGTGGIGLCITKELLNNGAKCVAIFELNNQTTQSVFNDLKKEYGDRVEFYSCDVSKSNQLNDNMDKVIETHKTIDILINNAAIFECENHELLIDVNFKAVVLGNYAMIKRVDKNNGGQGGLIVNIASVLGLMYVTMTPTYCATKHGVVSFTKSITDACEAAGVRVMAVCPGLTKTHMTTGVIQQKMIETAEAKYKMYFPKQAPENVALAVISIIKNGKNGDIWVSENDEPPYPAKLVDSYINKFYL